MIKINLCPIDELESQFWYVPDVGAVFLVALLSLLGAHYFLSSLQDEVDDANAKKASLEENTARLKQGGELERYKSLEDDIGKLNSKLQALQSITVSKVARYKPIIVLEHLQNLKPEGVWYTSVHILTGNASAVSSSSGMGPGPVGPGNGGGGGNGLIAGPTFEITGRALDNILTSELMTNIRATESQDVDNADLRTQVYFTNLNLKQAVAGTASGAAVAPEFATVPEFTIHGDFAERTATANAGMPNGGVSAVPKAAAPAPNRAPVSQADPPRKSAISSTSEHERTRLWKS